MIVTEDEAKQKLCHRTLSSWRHEAAGSAAGSGGGGGMLPTPQYCLGSRCMAWREVYSASLDNPTREPNKGFGRKLIGGFCGLAGNPYGDYN